MQIKESRLHFLDNLRTSLIFLVVLYHSGAVYESSGILGPFWIVDDPATNNLSGLVNLIIDIFVMSTLFFISGYFAPLSMKNKDRWLFLRSKFKRLMVPWLIAVFTLIPIYKVIFLYSRNLPQENWTTYFYFNNEISQSWLWFLPVLFLFNMLYVPFHETNVKISFKKVILVVFMIGYANSMLASLLGMQGWTKTALIDFQNERFLIYLLFFFLGSIGFKKKIFGQEITRKKFYYTINAIAWIPINIYIIFLVYLLINYGKGKYIISATMDKFVLWLGFHLALLCLVYLAIATFRYYLNKQGNIWRLLNQNSYGVYIIHLIVVGAIALAILDTNISSLWKYLILTVTSYAACNLIVYMYRKTKPKLLSQKLN